MKTLETCEICREKTSGFLFTLTDKNLGVAGKFRLEKCQKCGLIFLNPQHSYREIEKHYPSKKYYSLGRISTKEDSIKTEIKLKLYQTYFSGDKNILQRMIFSPIKFMVRGTIIKKNVKLLDIGCGSGQFLYEMKQFGIDTYGIEPGEFEKEDLNLNIKRTTLKDAKFKDEAFDLITMNHVLEHVDNPSETLLEITRILKKDGMFIIGVPNTNSLAFRIFKKNWYQLDVPRHLFNYSDKNLKELLVKSGFAIKRVRYNSRPSQFVVSLEYLLNKKFKGFVKLVLTCIFLPLTWIVNSMRVGDQIEIWCERK